MNKMPQAPYLHYNNKNNNSTTLSAPKQNAQFQFYNFSRLIREFGGGPRLPLPNVKMIADHIYTFSLAGLRGLKEGACSQ